MCFMQMSIGLAFANRVSQTILQERRCFRWAPPRSGQPHFGPFELPNLGATEKRLSPRAADRRLNSTTLNADPDESYDVSAKHPDVVAQIRGKVEALVAGFPAEVKQA
jgi:hypothetical protein